MPKKLIPNPEFEKARYVTQTIWHPNARPHNEPPEMRTNNPKFISDGMPEADLIPSHILVEDGDPDLKTVPNPDYVSAPYSDVRLNEEQTKALLPKGLVERMED